MLFIKNKIRSILNKFIESNLKVGKIELIEKKLKRLTYLINDIYPENIFINEKCKEIIFKLLIDNNIDKNSVNLSISKSDLMFHFWLLHCYSIEDAIFWYFNSGIKHTFLLKTIIDQNHLDLHNIKILDFASGHGRITRFLINYLNARNIWISDIKQHALDFQMNEFKVNIVNSGKSPSDFNINIKFDIIIVSSLFTHLPENLFKTWFIKLYNLLTHEGILVITTHDIELTKIKSNFKFIPSSEETLFPEYEENIDQKEIYGTSYISEEKVKSILNELSLSNSYMKRYPKLWGSQDLYIFSNKVLKDIIFEES